MTADECRLTGWYHSVMTILVSELSKLIHMCLMIHSLCITYGSIRTYKLFVRAYGENFDQYLDVKCQSTRILQKWVNLYATMLEKFKVQGHCVMMDSTYMGDIMTLIGGHKWKINMVGIAQEHETGTGTVTEKKKMKNTSKL